MRLHTRSSAERKPKIEMGFDWNNPYYLLHRAATFDGKYGIDKATYKMFRTNLAQFLEFRAKNLSIFNGEVSLRGQKADKPVYDMI